MLLGEFIHNLAKKAGIKEDDEDFKNFISADFFQKTEIPETIVEGIDNKLISLTDATNNHPTIKNVYHAQVLDRFDKNIFERAPLYGLSEDMIAEIKAEKNSYKRQELFEKRILEVAERRANGDDKTVRSQMQKQIDELQNLQKLSNEEKERIKAEFEERDLNRRKDFHLNELLREYKTQFDTLPPGVRNKTLRDLAEDRLNAKNAKFDFDNDNFVLRQKDGSNFYGDNNQQWEPKKFLDHVFAENKILTVTPAPGAENNTGGQNNSGRVPLSGNGGNAPVNGTLQALINNARQSAAANQ